MMMTRQKQRMLPIATRDDQDAHDVNRRDPKRERRERTKGRGKRRER